MFLCLILFHGSKRGSEASLGDVPFETCGPEGGNHYVLLLRSMEWILREIDSEFDITSLMGDMFPTRMVIFELIWSNNRGKANVGSPLNVTLDDIQHWVYPGFCSNNTKMRAIKTTKQQSLVKKNVPYCDFWHDCQLGAIHESPLIEVRMIRIRTI
jgi:hypothetical protein